MKRVYQYVIVGFVGLLIFACAKEGLWNQNSEIPEAEKGTIVGQLINDDNNQPLKGIKILFERQTKKDGSNTFVDTVSTDTEGKFSYSVPFPNKVRMVVRDTGRYHADTAFVEVLAHQNYPIMMNSHPRFGVMSVNVHVNDTDVNKPFGGIHVSLLQRESNNESYSMVQTLVADAEGNVKFDEIAWPVNYKVRIEEDSTRYQVDSLSGKIATKDPLNLTLNSEPLFGKSSVAALVKNEQNEAFKWPVKVALYLRQNKDEDYVKHTTLTTDKQGKVLFENIDFPIEYKIVLDERDRAYDYEPIEAVLKKSRQAVTETLVAKSNFAQGDITLKAWWFFQNQIAANERLLVSYKSVLDDKFSDPVTITVNGNGDYTFPNFDYPAEIKIDASPLSSSEFQKTSIYVESENAASTIRVNLYDNTPRYTTFPPPSDAKASNGVTLFYTGTDEIINGMATDSRGNLYAVTNKNQLIRYTMNGVRSVIAGSGLEGNANGAGDVAQFRSATGVAVQDDTTLYVIENSSAHTIRKVSIDPRTSKSQVSLFSGTYGSTQSGQNVSAGEVSIASAKYTRPSSAVYDKSRKCLWVSEWEGNRVRKIDIEGNKVTTVVSATDAFGKGFFNSVTLTPDNKYLYIASHSSLAGVYKYDIAADKLYVVRTGYSFRYVAAAAVGSPNTHRVFITLDGSSYSVVYSLPNESLVATSASNLTPGNTNTGLNQMAGNNNITAPDNLTLGVAQKQIDGTSGTKPFSKNSSNVGPYPLTYDAYTGRLYVATPMQKSVFYIKLW